MPTLNSDISDIFNQTADVLEIQGANAFRVRAYRNAARVIGNWPTPLTDLIRRGEDLPKLPGIGSDLASKIHEIARTGRLRLLEEVGREVPEELRELMRIPGLGPKRVRALQTQLGIQSRQALAAAARQGKIRVVSAFGPKLEEAILRALEQQRTSPTRMRLAAAEQAVEPLLTYLCGSRGVVDAAAAGSFRCRDVVDRFVEYEDVTSVVSHGKTRSTVLLRSGLQVDLRVVPEKSYGAALHYFTRSKAHNIAIRRLGMQRGLKINEYGVFRGKRTIGGRTEAEVFRHVGLPYIEPELREDRGEIEAARSGKLPRLVTVEEIRGDLHAHTRATDGRLGLEEMGRAARSLGYEYLAITDHSRRLTVAHGLDPFRLRQQIRAIDRFNEKARGFRLLKAIEVDILEDGTLDLPDSVLSLLDLTVCSVHSKFDLPERKQTERILRAMDNPHFHILGHPTGRLLGTREPYAVDVERVIRGARDRGCFLELNAQPERMDLSEIYARHARELGVPIVISTDAHSDHDLGYMKFGVAQARRAWLEAADVVNTRSWEEICGMRRRRSARMAA